MIVSKLQSGLANRIKCIASTIRLANLNNINYEIMWYKNVVPPYEKEEVKLTDYFVGLNECLHDDTENKSMWETWRLLVLESDVSENFSFIEQQKLKNEYGEIFSPFVPNGKCIDFEYERIPENVRSEYRPIFNLLKNHVNPEINNLVQNFSKNFDKNTVSVHIRTWCDCSERNQKYHDINKYIELMNEHKNNKFFVCSDSLETISQLKDIFGEQRIIKR